jgi:hypothetical protein
MIRVVEVYFQRASLRSILPHFTLLLSLTTQFVNAQPHTLTGTVTIPGNGFARNDSTFFYCYLVDYTGSPGDTLKETSTGCGYHDGIYWIQCANFSNPWSPGKLIRIEVWEFFGGSATEELVLTGEPYDQLNISLQGSTIEDPPYVSTQIKTYIEGAYDSEGRMQTELNESGALPLESPYSDGRTASSIPDQIVDWIRVELRGSKNGGSVVSKSFFLRNDGFITELDGLTTALRFDDVTSGYYYILLKHRNHLAVMSADSIYLFP